MNKIFFKAFFLVAALAGLVSCNLNKEPKSALEQKPFENFQEAKMFREGLYARLRAVEAPSGLVICDYQTPVFSTAYDDGNTVGAFYNWDEISLSSESSIDSYYARYYALIMQTNYFEMRVKEAVGNKSNLISSKKFVEDDFVAMEDFLAEAKVMRALAYYRLMTRFSYRYEDGSDRGLVLLDSYKLDTKNKQVSQKEIYDYALRILDEAAAVMPDSYEGERQNGVPQYMPKAYAYAVKARILLEMHNYPEVVNTLNKFIGDYPLTDISAMTAEEKLKIFNKIYLTEDSPEIVAKLYSSSHIGASEGPIHGLIYDKGLGPVYYLGYHFPSQALLDLYAAEGNALDEDVRVSAYFEEAPQYRLGVQSVVNFRKFYGNPSLRKNADIPDFLVSTHLFNIAEAYLMLAEAYAFDNKASEALRVINELRAARGVATKIEASAVGTPKEAQELVKRERLRELVGEGHHFNDLKRWGDPVDFTKYPPQASIKSVMKSKNASLVVPYDKKAPKGKMFAWEFPKNDLMTNPNLKSNWSKK